MTTREEILTQLRRCNLTTAELAKRLGLSRNAVVVPLGQLIGEGIVRQATVRRSGQAGKPAHEFEIVPGHEDSLSSAYRPFVEALLSVLPRHKTEAEISALMRDIGQEMASGIASADRENFAEKLAAARSIVDGLGAATELIVDEDRITVQSLSCPLATAVRKEKCVCQAVAAFFEAATGRKTTERCLRQDKLKCRFDIEEGQSLGEQTSHRRLSTHRQRSHSIRNTPQS